VRNRAVCLCPWDTAVGVSVQRGLRAGLAPVEGVVPPEAAVMAHTKIAGRAGNKDMRVSFPVSRWACRAERGVQQVVRTIVVGVDRMKK
jgi:hypothetical protein